ncbi:MAG: ribonuclease Z [Desulfobacterales bacterium]
MALQVIFSGVGEAFDENRTNTSMIVTHHTGGSLQQVLLDCGFSAAHAFWRHAPEPLNLDAVWVSHFHGDHFLGLPLLLLRFWEENRRKPLVIIGPAGVEAKVTAAMELAYPNFLPRIQYPIEFHPVNPADRLIMAGLSWSFAPNDHAQNCLALRISTADISLFYSGDGRPTSESEALAQNCDLMIHEAFTIETLQGGHGTVRDCIEFARRVKARMLALVHLNREVRNGQSGVLRQTLESVSDLKVLLPEGGDQVTLKSRRNTRKSR